MENSEHKCRQYHSELFPIRSEALKNVSAEDQFLGKRSQNGGVQEHTEGVALAGNTFQNLRYRSVKLIHHQLQPGNPQAVHQLRRHAQAGQHRKIARAHPAMAGKHRFPPEPVLLPAKQEQHSDGHRGDISPAVSHNALEIRLGQEPALAQRFQALAHCVRKNSSRHHEIHDPVVRHQEPANHPEFPAQKPIDVFFIHSGFPPFAL